MPSMIVKVRFNNRLIDKVCNKYPGVNGNCALSLTELVDGIAGTGYRKVVMAPIGQSSPRLDGSITLAQVVYEPRLGVSEGILPSSVSLLASSASLLSRGLLSLASYCAVSPGPDLCWAIGKRVH